MTFLFTLDARYSKLYAMQIPIFRTSRGAKVRPPSNLSRGVQVIVSYQQYAKFSDSGAPCPCPNGLVSPTSAVTSSSLLPQFLAIEYYSGRKFRLRNWSLRSHLSQRRVVTNGRLPTDQSLPPWSISSSARPSRHYRIAARNQLLKLSRIQGLGHRETAFGSPRHKLAGWSRRLNPVMCKV